MPLSRRSLFLGAGGLLLVGVSSMAMAEPAFAASPQTPAEVVAEAKTFIGKTRAQMNAIWSSSYDTNGEWCAAFVSYVLRGTDTINSKSSSALYNSLPHTTNPRKGDLVYYYNAGHIGLVTYVSGSVIHTLEGNAGTQGAALNKVKTYSAPWSSAVKYCRPAY